VFEGFFAIMKLWNVDRMQARRILGSPPMRTFYAWKAGQARRVPEDTLRRIGYVAGIYKALQMLFGDPAAWKEWIHKPNRDFGGRPALDRMLGGRVVDLADVRRYLDSWRGEHYA
jgi:hypothetical protein